RRRPACTPRGGDALLGGRGKTIPLRDAATGKEVRAFTGHRLEVTALALAPDGKTLASTGREGTLRLWDVDTGKEVRQIAAGPGAINAFAFAFSPDGTTLAASGGKGVRLWAGATGKLGREFEDDRRVTALAFAPDGKALATTTRSHALRLWDAATGKDLHPVGGHRQGVYRVVVSPDGRTVWSMGNSGGPVHAWDAAT